MKKFCIVGILVSFAILTLGPQDLLSQATPAQTRTDRSSNYWSRFKFELSTAISYQKSLLDSSYFHQYSPPFLSGAYDSLADHTIKLKGKDGWGFNVGFAFFPTEMFGVQFLVDYAKPKLSGGNTQYNVWLNYALSFDATPPYPYIFEYTYGWPNTAGDITEICLSLNGVFRLPVFEKLALYLSGGLTYFRVDGEGTGLAYSEYWYEAPWFLGDTFNYKYKIGPIRTLGLNIGAEFNWVLFSNMCFVLDARYFACPAKTLPMKIINEELNTKTPFDEINMTMNLQDLTVNPSFYRINLGLKYLF
jgi:opacity protein-like surface antigen